MKKTTLILVLGTLLSVVACKKDVNVNYGAGADGGQIEEIKTTVLDGVIKGDAWTFMSGRAKIDQFRPGRLVLNFWETSEADPCNVFFPTSSRNLITSIPKTVGSYELGNEMNVTFSYQSASEGSANLIATTGRMIVDEVTSDSVKGRFVAVYDDQNAVNGTFSLPLCN